jgi:hypothetical protein
MFSYGYRLSGNNCLQCTSNPVLPTNKYICFPMVTSGLVIIAYNLLTVLFLPLTTYVRMFSYSYSLSSNYCLQSSNRFLLTNNYILYVHMFFNSYSLSSNSPPACLIMAICRYAVLQLPGRGLYPHHGRDTHHRDLSQDRLRLRYIYSEHRQKPVYVPEHM